MEKKKKLSLFFPLDPGTSTLFLGPNGFSGSIMGPNNGKDDFERRSRRRRNGDYYIVVDRRRYFNCSLPSFRVSNVEKLASEDEDWIGRFRENAEIEIKIRDHLASPFEFECKSGKNLLSKLPRAHS